jgi:DNA-binding winged helix-turn-helix (wHTH) protein
LYQFFGAISQDSGQRVDHIAREGRVNVQMPNVRDKILPHSKSTTDELPSPDIKRWTVRRKGLVVEAVRSGVITLEEVCRRSDLTAEELLSWDHTMLRHGVRGLRATEFQKYRCSTPEGMRGSAVDRQSMIQVDDLVVDLTTRTASVDGKRMLLTPKQYCILELLTLHKDIVVTKEMLLAHLYEGMGEPAMKIIDVFVCQLRKKLAQATGGKHYIETVWGRGYRLRARSQVSPQFRP